MRYISLYAFEEDWEGKCSVFVIVSPKKWVMCCYQLHFLLYVGAGASTGWRQDGSICHTYSSSAMPHRAYCSQGIFLAFLKQVWVVDFFLVRFEPLVMLVTLVRLSIRWSVCASINILVILLQRWCNKKVPNIKSLTVIDCLVFLSRLKEFKERLCSYQELIWLMERYSAPYDIPYSADILLQLVDYSRSRIFN